MHDDELQLLNEKLAREYQWQDELRRSVEHNNAIIKRLEAQLYQATPEEKKYA